MFRKRNQRSYPSVVARQRQRGFLIPLSLFIVVAMGLLALALTRTSTQTAVASAQELMSVQALYAAESGAQAGMQALFYDENFIDRTFDSVNSACQTMAQTFSFDGVLGLTSCRAVLSCGCETCADVNAVTGFYTLESRGECGSGITAAARTVRVGASLDKQ